MAWADVTQRAYEETELNWTYLTFMTLATLIAGIAIVLDSQILVIGAMVLGAGVLRGCRTRAGARSTSTGHVSGRAARRLRGFRRGLGRTTVAALIGASLGWVTHRRYQWASGRSTDFIYTPDKWSFEIVALIAAAAGRAVPDLG